MTQDAAAALPGNYYRVGCNCGVNNHLHVTTCPMAVADPLVELFVIRSQLMETSTRLCDRKSERCRHRAVHEPHSYDCPGYWVHGALDMVSQFTLKADMVWRATCFEAADGVRVRLRTMPISKRVCWVVERTTSGTVEVLGREGWLLNHLDGEGGWQYETPLDAWKAIEEAKLTSVGGSGDNE